jgi:hypothetical protein
MPGPTVLETGPFRSTPGVERLLGGSADRLLRREVEPLVVALEPDPHLLATARIRTIRPTILHDAWLSDPRKSACAIRSLAVAWPVRLPQMPDRRTPGPRISPIWSDAPHPNHFPTLCLHRP